MKRLFMTALAVLSLTACNKGIHEIDLPKPDENTITVSFVGEPNTTRTFFDPTSTAET